jgi:hypothetical protein
VQAGHRCCIMVGWRPSGGLRCGGRAVNGRLEAVPVSVGSDGSVILVEAHVPASEDPSGEEEVGALSHAFDSICDSLGEATTKLAGALRSLAPDEVTLELGFDVALENGVLVAFLVKGTGTASIKVTVTWKDGTPAAKNGG